MLSECYFLKERTNDEMQHFWRNCSKYLVGFFKACRRLQSRPGSVVEFMNDVAAVGNFTWTHKPISNASRSRFTSSYTACVHDVALNETDICVGPFWLTPERLLMTPFTVPLFSETFTLVLPDADDGANFMAQLTNARNWDVPFRPFTIHAWLLICSVTILSSIAFYTVQMEGDGKDTSFVGDSFESVMRDVRQLSTETRLKDETIRKAMRLPNDNVRRDRPISSADKPHCSWTSKSGWVRDIVPKRVSEPTYSIFLGFTGLMEGASLHEHMRGGVAGKIVKLGFAFFILIIYTSYTACTAALLMQASAGRDMTIDMLEADTAKKLCILTAAKRDFMLWRPSFPENRLVTSDLIVDHVPRIRSGMCYAMLVQHDGWDAVKGAAGNCNLTSTDNGWQEFTIPSAMPVSPDFEDPISYLIAKLRVTGRYSILRKKHVLAQQYPDECKKHSWIASGDKSGGSGAMLGVSDLSFPLGVTIAASLLGALLQWVIGPAASWVLLWYDVRALREEFSVHARNEHHIAWRIVVPGPIFDALEHSRMFNDDGTVSIAHTYDLARARQHMKKKNIVSPKLNHEALRSSPPVPRAQP